VNKLSNHHYTHRNDFQEVCRIISQGGSASTVETDPRVPRIEQLIAEAEEIARATGRNPAKQYHIFRGGGWDNYPGFVRSADRYISHSPTIRSQRASSRVVLEVD